MRLSLFFLLNSYWIEEEEEALQSTRLASSVVKTHSRLVKLYTKC